MPPIQLTSSQKVAIQALLNSGTNVFLTGAPGTGKSFLITEFRRLSERKIPIIASTGAAAILVGGRTFHSYFGLGIMQGGAEGTFKRALKNSTLRKRLKDAVTLIIDEVSMISYDAFDLAERLARHIRKSEMAWGGIRIIAVGDFAQLPPISRDMRKQWCFLGEAWQRSGFHKVELTEVKRTLDQSFLEVLEDVRWGRKTEKVEAFLNSRLVTNEEVEADVPHVFPRRDQTFAFNKARLAEVKNPLKVFETEYGGPKHYVERLKKDAPIPEKLELKLGALVMIRVNDPKQRYVNGTVGKVVQMDEEFITVRVGHRDYEIEPFAFTILDDDGEEVAYAENFPLSLAYANTIHKIQGTTLDRVHIYLKNLWEPGQAYVALSRARSGKGVTLMGWDARSIKSDETVERFYGGMSEVSV